MEVLRAHLRSAADGPLIEGPLADHLALLLPELGPATPKGDPATLFEAIRLALATIAAQQPTAIFLDDLQWADDATLELLPALARTLLEQPLLILAAYRSDELRERTRSGECAASCVVLDTCDRSQSNHSTRRPLRHWWTGFWDQSHRLCAAPCSIGRMAFRCM